MNRVALIRNSKLPASGGALGVLLCAVSFLIIVSTGKTRAGETNSSFQWPLLTNIVQKWDATSETEVKKAAESGEPTAQHYLGYSYTTGHRFAPDTQLGIGWYERAGKGGYLPSIYNLGTLYDSGLVVPRDLAKAFQYYQTAAAGFALARNVVTQRIGGLPAAQYELGRDYFNFRERGVPRDEERGLECFRQAADAGDERAALDLARAYAHGIGEPRNKRDEPNEILLRLIAAGSPNRYVYEELIFRYENGLGGLVDLIAGAEIYCRAARVGAETFDVRDKVEAAPQRPAPYSLNTRGSGDTPFSPSSILGGKLEHEFFVYLSLYLKAAKGDGSARLKIGEAYLTGRNVPVDAARAWAWFTLAADRNVPDAALKAAEAKALLTPEESRDAGGLPQKIAADLAWVAALIGGGPSR